MKKTEEKGVTLIALVITVIILAILTTIGTRAGLSSMNSSKFLEFKEELKIMQAKVNELNSKNETNIGKNLTTDQEKILVEDNIAKIIYPVGATADEKSDIRTYFRYCSKEYINETLGVEGITRDFLLNVKDRYVVSAKGFEYKDKIYYMTQQLDDGLYNVSYNNNVTGDFTLKSTKEDGRYKIDVNITSDYVSNWEVKYKLEEDSYWKTTDSTTFYVDIDGSYLVKVVHGDDIDLGTKTIELFEFGAQIGDYVEYDIPYTDMATGYEFTATNGWRILDPGKRNSDGTYTGMKLIATGIPVKLNYNYKVSNNVWWGTDDQVKQTYNITDNNTSLYKVACGLKLNFKNITFEYQNASEYNKGSYTKINGKTDESITGEEFIIPEKSINVSNILIDDIYRTRNNYNVNVSTDSVDGDIGLFCLKNLEKENAVYGYKESDADTDFKYAYILGIGDKSKKLSLSAQYTDSLAYIYSDGSFYASTSAANFALRPVVTLVNRAELIPTDNDNLWKIK